MKIYCVIHFLVCYKYTFTAIYGIFVHKYIESVKMKKKNIRCIYSPTSLLGTPVQLLVNTNMWLAHMHFAM